MKVRYTRMIVFDSFDPDKHMLVASAVDPKLHLEQANALTLCYCAFRLTASDGCHQFTAFLFFGSFLVMLLAPESF